MKKHFGHAVVMTSVLLAAAPVLAQTATDAGKQQTQSLAHGDAAKQKTQSLAHGDAAKQQTQSLAHAGPGSGGATKQQ
jgi:uncharacterized low-complexity protein